MRRKNRTCSQLRSLFHAMLNTELFEHFFSMIAFFTDVSLSTGIVYKSLSCPSRGLPYIMHTCQKTVMPPGYKVGCHFICCIASDIAVGLLNTCHASVSGLGVTWFYAGTSKPLVIICRKVECRHILWLLRKK